MSGGPNVSWGTPVGAFALADFLDTIPKSYDLTSNGEAPFMGEALTIRSVPLGTRFEELKRLVPTD